MCCHHSHNHAHQHSHYHQQHLSQSYQHSNQIYQQIPADVPTSQAAPGTSTHQTVPSTGAPTTTTVANSTHSSATLRRQPSSVSTQNKEPDTVEAIPSSNSIDSAMYERDKQIYRCSTLRQGGKWDPKYKPSILNCPLPEIPKEAESPKKEVHREQNSKTLQRPPMKLPAAGKAIPPPKIDIQTSPPPVPPSVSKRVVSPPPTSSSSVATMSRSGSGQQKSPPPITVQSPNANPTTIRNTPPGPDNSTINPNDESNYAVTEL